MKLGEKQLQVKQAFDIPGIRRIVTYGSGRSGKTSSLVWSFCEKARSYSPTYDDGKVRYFGIAAFTDDQYNTVINEEVRAYCHATGTIMGRPTVPEIPRTQGFSLTNKFGERINFKKILGGDAGSVSKLLGKSFQMILVDEAVEMPMDILQVMMSRLDKPGSLIAYSMNPKSPSHPFKTQIIDRITGTDDPAGEGMTLLDDNDNPVEGHGSLNGVVFHMTWDDNPGIDSGYMQEQRREYRDLPAMWARYVDGIWYAAEGAIYPYAREAYGVSPLTLAQKYVVTVDVSDAGNTHALLIGKWPSCNWVVDEYVNNGKMEPLTHLDKVRRIIEKFSYVPVSGYIIDPKALNFRRHMKDESGKITRSWTDKAGIRVLEGIQYTSNQMSYDTLKIDADRCPVLCANLGEYSWDEKAAEQGEMKPSKLHSDGPDALRGFATEEQIYRRLKKIKEGTAVCL